MPTKKRRVGFIPRSAVLDLINKLSYESNLSYSKIINILVEEALYERGLFNIETGEVFSRDKVSKNNIRIENNSKENNNELKNKFIKLENFDTREETFDKEIYSKFLMFLQFQERMRKETYE